jgi:hypothetical protein
LPWEDIEKIARKAIPASFVGGWPVVPGRRQSNRDVKENDDDSDSDWDNEVTGSEEGELIVEEDEEVPQTLAVGFYGASLTHPAHVLLFSCQSRTLSDRHHDCNIDAPPLPQCYVQICSHYRPNHTSTVSKARYCETDML